MKGAKYSYKIFPELNLLIRQFRGSINVHDILESLEEIIKEDKFSPTMNFLNDIRDIEIQLVTTEILDLINSIKSNKKAYAKRESVILTNSPNQVVFGTLVADFEKDKQVRVSIVSTLDAAISRLGIPQEFEQYVVKTIEFFKREH